MERKSILALAAILVCGCTGEEGPAGPAGSGLAGESCQVTSNGNGTHTITCGETSVTVNDGASGEDGASCSVTDNGNGTKTVSCTDGTSITVADGAAGEDGDGCSVEDLGNGTKAINCEDGTSVIVTDGQDGEIGGGCTIEVGSNGNSTITCADGSTVVITTSGGGAEITRFHGTDALMSGGEFAEGKVYVDAAITAATADTAGKVTLELRVLDREGDPITDLEKVSANIARLVPGTAAEASSKWVPYIARAQTVSGSATGNWPNPDGTSMMQGSRETNGTLTNHGDGTYTYAFATTLPAGYERNLTHRVSIMMGGHSGATADAVFDFVPDGSGPVQTRDIVATEACKSCHGEEFHGHGGDRLTVENCVTCHDPGSADPHGGETIDFKVMIHKIHAGRDLASIPGDDGIVFDDPSTAAIDESADNGSYAIWGNRNSKHEWSGESFPAVIQNCTKCHQGDGADVDNWKSVPSRDACGSCHDDVDFATGANHAGGAATSDAACSTCHPASGSGLSVSNAHEWWKKDPRNLEEFEVDVTVSPPANGAFFVAGETPLVTITLLENGAPIDHTTVVEDVTPEGCLPTGCPPRDGAFHESLLFVTGPRGSPSPVLTTAARAKIVATGAGPFDLSASGASLVLKLDGGRDVVKRDVSGGDKVLAGTITVPVASGAFADKAAATAQEIVTWLNGNAAFKARAIAYVENGKPVIRSRNLGTTFSVQLQTSAVATAVFGGDTNPKVIGGYYVGNNFSARINPANDDPKAVRTPGSITYRLDPVDDLKPGTYIAYVAVSDGGRKSADEYRTPSWAKATFQVGQADEEPRIAGNCGSCHQGPDGKGFVLDFSRHNKVFNDTATDQCIACHDYQPASATGEWSGGHPLSKRVHAVHFGAQLNYPLATVGYSNGDPVKGRNWHITFPQDVRNCESCHTNDTSGSWAGEPGRLACSGCHDSDAGNAHLRNMTWDPTPADPWSGDEKEACSTCHN